MRSSAAKPHGPEAAANKETEVTTDSVTAEVTTEAEAAEEVEEGRSLPHLLGDAQNCLRDSRMEDVVQRLEQPWAAFFQHLHPHFLSFPPSDAGKPPTAEQQQQQQQEQSSIGISVPTHTSGVTPLQRLAHDIRRCRVSLHALYSSKHLHGIATPAMPAHAWRGSTYWAKYKHVHFQALFEVLCAQDWLAASPVSE
jgi:hypothetical protein